MGKQGLFGRREYGSEVTSNYDVYEVKYSFIVCPLCGCITELNPCVSSKKIDSKTETEKKDEWKTFGPNSPNIVGNSAFDYAKRHDF